MTDAGAARETDAGIDGAMAGVYDELRRLAAAALRRERPDHTLQPTALVNEAYLRLARADAEVGADRARFVGIAARVIRQVLVDHARKTNSLKRGGDWSRLTLSTRVARDDEDARIDLLDLDRVLTRLAELDARQARVVELRFFGGLDDESIARLLDVSPRTVRGDWTVARAWLWRALGEGRA